ncbi:adhesion G-protein coupled receptor G4-like, partial [Clarias magur]
FEVLAHLNVIPHEDVGKIQKQVVKILKDGYHLYEDYSLLTHTDFMQVYPT